MSAALPLYLDVRKLQLDIPIDVVSDVVFQFARWCGWPRCGTRDDKPQILNPQP